MSAIDTTTIEVDVSVPVAVPVSRRITFKKGAVPIIRVANKTEEKMLPLAVIYASELLDFLEKNGLFKKGVTVDTLLKD